MWWGANVVLRALPLIKGGAIIRSFHQIREGASTKKGCATIFGDIYLIWRGVILNKRTPTNLGGR